VAVTWLLPDFGLGVDVFNGLRLRDKPLHACHGRVVDPDILLVAPAAKPSSVCLSNQLNGAHGQAESATSAVRVVVHAALVRLFARADRQGLRSQMQILLQSAHSKSTMPNLAATAGS
jgi:hypothetical protein